MPINEAKLNDFMGKIVGDLGATMSGAPEFGRPDSNQADRIHGVFASWSC